MDYACDSKFVDIPYSAKFSIKPLENFALYGSSAIMLIISENHEHLHAILW